MALHARYTHSLRSFVAAADLSVAAGETLALVGPSGAGKTTTLRVVAGLLRPDSGTVTVGERTLLDTTRGVDVAPEQRRVGYVFQEYALFPHLDVRGNVRFGARERDGVDALLERFGLGGLAGARVGELSGGERQRVALARALASDPDVLLLDEPLAALDAHTRATVRAELRGRLRSLGLPTLLVTHDFDDAATLADRVGVMGEGRVVQLGTATELVSTPVDPFVATFTGAVVLHGTAVGTRDGLTEVALEGGFTAWSVDRADGPVDLAVYPWDVSLGPATREDSRLNHLVAPVVSIAPVGNRVRVQVGPVVSEITAASAERLGLRAGETVTASFKATSTRLFPR
jgi:molybdate transport system ATP-binding protein